MRTAALTAMAALVLAAHTNGYSAEQFGKNDDLVIAWEVPHTGIINKTVVIKAGSVKVRDGLRQAWSETTYTKPISSENGSQYNVSMGMELYFCANEEISVLQRVTYLQTAGVSTVVSSSQLSRAEARATFEPVVPNSIGAEMLRVVCKAKVSNLRGRLPADAGSISASC